MSAASIFTNNNGDDSPHQISARGLYINNILVSQQIRSTPLQGRLTSLIRDPICVTPRTPSTTAAHRAEARDPIWPPAFDPLTRATFMRSHLRTCTPFRAASAIAPPDAPALTPRPGCHMHMSAHPPERPLPTTRRVGPRSMWRRLRSTRHTGCPRRARSSRLSPLIGHTHPNLGSLY